MKKKLTIFTTLLSEIKGIFPVFVFITLGSNPINAQNNFLVNPGNFGLTASLILVFLVAASAIFIMLLNRYINTREKKYLSEPEEIRSIDQMVTTEKRKLDDPENTPSYDKNEQFSETISSSLNKLIIWYVAAAAFWFVFGLLAQPYITLKLLWPDIDQMAPLSYGRLKAVYTNTVFWGWVTPAMIGLGYFIIGRTSKWSRHQTSLAWIAWGLINLSVLIGNVLLMSGINHGGAEYREYVWPIAIILVLALIITFFNYYQILNQQHLRLPDISHWYILAGLIASIILIGVAYIPGYQDGVGETVVQLFFQHQWLGLYFITCGLGIIYALLPMFTARPIFSYRLALWAFWLHLLIYWLPGYPFPEIIASNQSLKIMQGVFMAGSLLTALAGTFNFCLSILSPNRQLSKNRVFPFMIMTICFYLIAAIMGIYPLTGITPYLSEFSGFTTVHHFLIIHGMITFLLWAGTYIIIQKITLKEPKSIMLRLHFWLAFTGLFICLTSQLLGGSARVWSWYQNEAFIKSIILMKPYLTASLWGEFLYLLSHLIFIYNIYAMVKKEKTIVADQWTVTNSSLI